jgi:hypothetical protein
MFVVFNQSLSAFSHLILCLTFLMISLQASGHTDHDQRSESKYLGHQEIVGRYSLDYLNMRLSVRVVRGEEPFTHPVRLFVGYQIGKSPYRLLMGNRKTQNRRSYCDIDPEDTMVPEVMTREEAAHLMNKELESLSENDPLAAPGYYLVIPVYTFDFDRNDCVAAYEVFALDGLLE